MRNFRIPPRRFKRFVWIFLCVGTSPNAVVASFVGNVFNCLKRVSEIPSQSHLFGDFNGCMLHASLVGWKRVRVIAWKTIGFVCFGLCRSSLSLRFSLIFFHLSKTNLLFFGKNFLDFHLTCVLASFGSVKNAVEFHRVEFRVVFLFDCP